MTKTCINCGILYDDYFIKQIEKYRECDGMGCKITKEICPVCGNIIYLGGEEYAFTREEIEEFRKKNY